MFFACKCWEKVYDFFASNEPKLRSFQIRLNLRAIVTNVQLCGLKMVESNLCGFCYKKPETLIHLFSECKVVDVFWNNVSDWLSAKLRLNVNIGSFERLFGFQLQNSSEKELFIDSLLLFACFLIYRCKYSGTKTNMLKYFNLLNNVKPTEYLIAKRNNKIAIHNRKWAYLCIIEFTVKL